MSVTRHRKTPRRRVLLATLLAITTTLVACSSGQAIRRYDRTQLADSLDNPQHSPLLLGTFPLLKVIDGDTLKVGGLDQSLRLLAIDTEETFKTEKARRAYEEGWQRYLAAAEAKSHGPVKIPTPLGEDAKHFASDFFKGVHNVHLELDHPKEVRGRFNRFLTYVFADKDGERVNYNLECVRAGLSPYFTKYGYSRRFHGEFVAAQAEARAAGLGIWDPTKQHYTDYDARLAWWDARADYIAAFEAEAEKHNNYVVLTHFDSNDRLRALLGREVVVLATVGDVRLSNTGPTKVMLSRRMFSDFPVIFFDKEVFAATGILQHKGEHVQIRGIVSSWYNKYQKRDVLQIEVKLAGQVKLSPVVRPGREAPAAAADPKDRIDSADAQADATAAEDSLSSDSAPKPAAEDPAPAEPDTGETTNPPERGEHMPQHRAADEATTAPSKATDLSR